MSNLSENKILQRLNLRVNNLKTKYAITNEDLQAIQGLLDLYNNKSKELEEEIEKNKKLYEIKYIASTFINRPIKQFSIGEFRYKVNNVISKDKIREAIGTPYPEVGIKNIEELLEE